jgi:hypothetical protein
MKNRLMYWIFKWSTRSAINNAIELKDRRLAEKD